MADLDRLAETYDRHADALFAFLLQLTHSEAETRDLLQELFLRLARKPRILDQAANERSFLFRTAHNLFIDHCRRTATRHRYHHAAAAEEADTAFESEPSGGGEITPLAEIENAIAALPPEQRAVVHLKIWEKKTFEEIAATLRIPANTAASRYRYALDKLRRAARLEGEHHG